MRTQKSISEQLIDLLERLIFKLTSGRFIFTVVVAGVYAYLATNGLLEQNRINEITLVVLYAYFNRPRNDTNIGNDEENSVK